jgi:type IV secretory pathway VirJ component
MMKEKTIVGAAACILVIFICAGYVPADQNSPVGLKGLPIVEVPAPAGKGNDLAVLLSGDGGWAMLSQHISNLLSTDHGIPVVGFNSLKYFIKERTPEETANDIERIIRYYEEAWGKSRLILIGYSFGADVLPFIVSRLPQDIRSAVELVVFVSLGHSISFKFTLSDWLGSPDKKYDYQTIPEVRKLAGMNMLCVYGTDDKDTACTSAELPHMTVVPLQGGHGVGGDATDIVSDIMKALQ